MLQPPNSYNNITLNKGKPQREGAIKALGVPNFENILNNISI